MSLQKMFRSLPKQTEFYVVIFLFVVVIFMGIHGRTGNIMPYGMGTSLSHSPYEGFTGSYPADVHSAANVTGQEEGAGKSNKGVLGMFEAAGLKAGPLDSTPINDPMSKLKGSPDCAGSIYSNSSGGICVPGDAKLPFVNRGGNFT